MRSAAGRLALTGQALAAGARLGAAVEALTTMAGPRGTWALTDPPGLTLELAGGHHPSPQLACASQACSLQVVTGSGHLPLGLCAQMAGMEAAGASGMAAAA